MQVCSEGRQNSSSHSVNQLNQQASQLCGLLALNGEATRNH